MRATLLAINEELLRLKATGVKNVAVSDESIRTLRALVGTPSPVIGSPSAGTPVKREMTPPTAGFSTSQAPVKATPAAVVVPRLPAPPTVELPEGSKQERWDALLKLVHDDAVCAAAVRPGKKLVLGTGKLDADIFFCGEAPGAEEENQGEPFVGPAGQLLDKMILGMGLRREEIYIGNIMNWRPQIPTEDGREQVGNRPPNAEELNYCLPYLRAQLEIVQPKVIVALGATAAKGLLGQDRFKALGEIRGKWQSFTDVPVMVTYHPSYILRNQSHRSKRAIWEDLLQVMAKVEMPISEKQRGFFLPK